jgi:ABC-type glycerol-3-phosphate transport system substrate-binding protein
MKKSLIILITVIFTVSALALSASKKKAGEEPAKMEAKKVVEISFWNQWNDPGDRKAGDILLQKWATDYPNIKITQRILPNDTAEELMRNSFASGNPPDVYAQQNAYDLFKQSDLGLIGDLSEFWAKYGDRFPKSSIPYTLHKDKYWAAPVRLLTLGHIYYNKDILAKYNIPVPKEWNDFIAASETLKKKGVLPFALGVKAGWPGLHWFQTFTCITVGAPDILAVIARTNKGQTPKWTDPGFVKAAEYYKSLFDMGFVDKGAGMLDYDSATTQFFSGKAAFFFTGSWFQQLGPPPDLNWGLVPFPNIPGEPAADRYDRTITFLECYGYSTACKNPKEAVLFIEFLTRPENARLFFTEAANIPATIGAVDYDEFNEAQKMYWDLASEATGAIPFIETWVNPEAGFGEMYNGATGIATGLLTPKEWMQRIEDAQQLSLK